MWRRITTLFEFSLVNVLLMAGIFILIVLYVALLIHLKPSLKTEKPTKTELESEIQQQTPEEEPVETSVQPIMPVENKEILEELPTPTEALEQPKAELQTIKEPVPPSPQEVSETKEVISYKARKLPIKEVPPGCSYHFGYIGELPKNTPIPDECLGCLKIMECLISRSTNSKT